MTATNVKVRGYFLIVTGFAVCPCHLPLTLPLLLALTAGTAISAFLANNVWLIVMVSTAYFVSTLALGWRSVMRNEIACVMQVRNDISNGQKSRVTVRNGS